MAATVPSGARHEDHVPPMSPTEGRRPATPPDPSHFRHSYSKDKAQLVRRLSRMEGQVRGIARMIEREEYCVDILQQTAALRAAVDALSIIVLEDHVQRLRPDGRRARRGGPVRRRGDRRRAADARPARPQRWTSQLRPAGYPRIQRPRDALVENPVDAGHPGRLPSGIRTGVDARVTRSARGTGKPGHEPNGLGKTKPRPWCETSRRRERRRAVGRHASHWRRAVDDTA